MREIRFIDLFCGIGGFRHGLEKVGRLQQAIQQSGDGGIIEGDGSRSQFTCAWSNDNDKYACQIYRKNWGNGELQETDIRTVDSSTIPEHDLLTAGFPCQSFSIAGKRRGFEDTRGTLFYEICRVARAKRTPYLLLENVKGLLSHDNGSTFQTIIRTLDELGYDCQWQVLNSKDFGVPQNRERVFIVGHLREEPRPEVFPLGEDDRQDNEMAKPGEPLAESLTARGAGEYHSGMQLVGEPIETRTDEGIRKFNGKTMGTIRAKKFGGDKAIMLHMRRERVGEWGDGIKEGDEPSFTLDPGAGRDLVVLDALSHREAEYLGALRQNTGNSGPLIANALDADGYLRTGARPRGENGKPQLLPIGYRRIRRLTPLECERLQGFPDGWTEGISDTQRYKCLGNAVTVNVIEVIGMRLLEEISG